MIRFLWLFFLFLLCYYLITSIIGLLKGKPHRPPPEKRPEGETMVRDPHCGTFVPRSLAVKKVIKGKTCYFCSEECMKKYEKKKKYE
jgi:YHS domain-containing protein